MHYIIWLIFSGIAFAIGEFWSKKFALEPKIINALWVFAAYIAGTSFWLPAILEKNQLSIVGTMWSVLGLLATILIGILIFREKLNLYGIAGILLAIISVILLSKNG
jgi:small multidrug resistance pump